MTPTDSLHADLIRVRHELHRRPELGLTLPQTQAVIQRELTGLPLQITIGRSLSSVVAVLEGARPGPSILLRADMDGLPVQEETGLPFESEIPGAMHACGHDMHVAMLIGAARLLADQRQRLAGQVVFMFQPGEEGWFGAQKMIDEGVLEAARAPVTAAYGLHVYSGLRPAGTFACRVGAQTSASARLKVTVRGRAGHGSRPHLAADPVPALCEMVLGLQAALTRNIDIFDPAVITVGHLEAGTKRNVIPATAHFDATVRSFSPAAADQIEEVATRYCRGIADAHGLDADVVYEREYPPMIGTAEAYHRVANTVRESFGDDRFHELDHPMYGSEDFSYILDRVAGTFVVLCAAPGDVPLDQAPSNHSGQVRYDDGVLRDGSELLARLAIAHLSPPIQLAP